MNYDLQNITIEHLIWDDWNINHISRHDVNRTEIEEVCQSNPVFRDGHSGRLVVIGLTLKGRMLAVVLDPETEKGTFYPVTARPVGKKEKQNFQKEKG